MSTAVFLSAPAPGHIHPTLPLMAELVRRGERVIYYSLEEFQPLIERTGATFRSYGQDFPLFDYIPDIDKITNPFLVIELFLQTSQWVLDHLLDDIRALQPDYIIQDSFCPWGKFAAQALRLPAVASVPSIAFNRKIMAAGPRELVDLIGMLWSGYKPLQHGRKLLQDMKARHDITPPRNILALFRNYAALNIVYTSRLFQPYADSFDEQQFKFVGPSRFQRQDAPAFPFEQLGPQPLIYISLGTVYNDRAAFFRTCIEAFAESKYQMVMATGGKVQREALGAIPDNVIVRPYVPQQEVLERSALFITHGGMNSVSDAFLAHVPMLLVPQRADQPWVAKRIVELGAGKVLALRNVTANSLRQAVEEILSHPGYKKAAVQVGESLHLAGGHQRAADEIEAFKRMQRIA
jgi:MGT family glycosyltransferase